MICLLIYPLELGRMIGIRILFVLIATTQFLEITLDIRESIVFVIVWDVKRREVVQTRKKLIEKQNRSNYPPIDYADLSLDYVLDLAVILQSLHASNLTNIGSFNSLPDMENEISITTLRHLARSGVLVVSVESPSEAIEVDENENEYNFFLDKVSWDINIVRKNTDNDQLLEILKSPNAGFPLDFIPSKVNEVYLELVLSELNQLVIYLFEDLSLTYSGDADHDKMKMAFQRWLISYTPAQIYSLLWATVRRADNSRTRGTWGNYRYHQTDFVIKLVDDLIESKSTRHAEVEPYKYPYQVEEHLRTKIFFSQVLIKPDWFNSMVPIKKEEDALEIASVNSLANLTYSYFTDLNKISLVIKNANSFSIKPYGILITFDNEVELFTDQLTLFQNFKQDNADSGWYERAQGIFKISHFYSLEFLLTLQKELLVSKISQE